MSHFQGKNSRKLAIFLGFTIIVFFFFSLSSEGWGDNIPQLVHSTIGGLFFQFCVNVNKVAMHILVHIFGRHMHSVLLRASKKGNCCAQHSCLFSFSKFCQYSKIAVHPQATYQQ